MIRAASAALLCAVAVLALAACRDQPELILESQVIEAFAAEGITLHVARRTDQTPEQEPPVKDVLLPTTFVEVEIRGCRSDFGVSIVGAIDRAVRGMQQKYPDISKETTRAEADGQINWRKRNVIIALRKGSTCAPERSVSAAAARLPG